MGVGLAPSLHLVLAAESGGTANTAEVAMFVVFGALALGAGVAMVMMRNIVHSALMLVINFLSIAALYLGLQSAFLSIVQVIVYAGAIMVLFLFVIMLLGVDRDDLLVETDRRHQVYAVLGAAGVAAVLLFGIAGTYTGADSRCGDQAPAGATRTSSTQPCAGMDLAIESNDSGSVGVVADRLFTRYSFPFELAAVLLTVATIGAMLLGRRSDPEVESAFEPSGPVPDDEDLELAAMATASIAAGESDAPLVSDDPEVTAAQEQLEPRPEPDTTLPSESAPNDDEGDA